MNLSDFDSEFAGLLRSQFRALEEQLSEASTRSLGGLRTEDQKFAYAVYEQTRATLHFLDHVHDLLEEVISSSNRLVDDRDEEIGLLNDKLTRVETYIDTYMKMETLRKIIRD